MAVSLALLVGVGILAWVLKSSTMDGAAPKEPPFASNDGRVDPLVLEPEGSAPQMGRSAIDHALPAVPDATPPTESKKELEAWQTTRVSELDRVFQELEDLTAAGTDTLFEIQSALVLCIVPILDEQRRFEEFQPGAKADMTMPPDGFVFSFRNRKYEIQRGEYPLYDFMMDSWTRRTKSIPKPDGLIHGDQEAPAPILVNPGQLEILNRMKADALAAIARRHDPY